MFFAVDLAVNCVARATGASYPFCPFSAVGATPLGHKTINNPVEGKAVVVTVIYQLDEISHGLRCIGVEQLDLKLACICFHQSLGHWSGSHVEWVNLGTSRWPLRIQINPNCLMP